MLMEAMASFMAGVDGADYQGGMPDVPPPESLESVEGNSRPTQTNSVDGGSASARSTRATSIRRRASPWTSTGHRTSMNRIWLRARGSVPADPVVGGCLATYLSALTLLESAQGPMGKSPTDVSALLDHAVWFHRAADFSDWLLFEQRSPTGSRRARAGDRLAVQPQSGALVCTATQEGYFPAAKNI